MISPDMEMITYLENKGFEFLIERFNSLLNMEIKYMLITLLKNVLIAMN